jgi:hypothetical protein
MNLVVTKFNFLKLTLRGMSIIIKVLVINYHRTFARQVTFYCYMYKRINQIFDQYVVENSIYHKIFILYFNQINTNTIPLFIFVNFIP